MRNSISLIILGVMLSIQACKKEKAPDDALTEQIQELLYKDVVSKWKVHDHDVKRTAPEKLENWNEFRLLQSELTQKPQATLGAIRKKSEIISQQTEQVMATIPSELHNNELISRLRVLLSKVKMLDTQTHQDYLSVERIIKYNSEVVVDFDLIEKQIERSVLKEKLKLDEVPLLYE